MLFGLILYLAIANSLTHTAGKVESYAQVEELLKRAIESPKSSSDLEKTAIAMETRKERSPSWARLTIALDFQTKRPLAAAAVSVLEKSTEKVDRDFLSLYRDPIDTPGLDARLSKLPNNPYVFNAARVQARTRAGIKPPKKPATTAGQRNIVRLELFLFLFGISAWWYFGRLYVEGKIRPLGLRLALITPIQADYLAVRAAWVMVITELAGFGVLFTHDRLGLALINLLAIPATLLLFRKPLLDWKVSLTDFGLSLDNLRGKILLGFVGFLLQFPVSMILAVVGNVIASRLPKSEHPLSQVIATDHSFAAIASAFIAASVIAPFSEEVIFRGLLFPAVTRLTRSPIWGAALTSFLFASLHPQGIALWGALASIGCMSCVLTYWTKSLVPSIVMHATHNTVILVVALLSSSG